MARAGLSLARFAVVATLFTSTAVAADDRIASTLAVQTALQQGRTHIVKGDFQAAVHVLESQITRIDGNSQYLAVLRDAYRGLVKTLKLAGHDDEAAVYVRRLQILDPGSTLDFPPTKPSTPAKPEVQPAAVTAAPPRKAPLAAPKAPILARGVMGKEQLPPPPDPFAESNSRKVHEARAELEQAEKLFQSQQYAEAGALYLKANDAAPEVVVEARERWAYCKIHVVVDRLNRNDKPIEKEEWPVLETQVRYAMAMTPKLEKYGETLLATLHDRRTGTAERAARAETPPAPETLVAVKHSRPAGSAWALAETTNFRIFHNLDGAKAEEVAKIVETTRAAMQKKWFGKVEETWEPRCDVYLYPNADSYSRATGIRSSAPGHARVSRSGERIVERQLHMNLEAPNVLTTVLPHETTHVVIAGRFGPVDVPRWADEGMAVLTEPREQVEKHLRNLPAHRDERSLFPVQGLLELNDYPHPRQIGAFYAQSVSLVEYLSSLKGPQTFSQFLTDGLRGGYEPALRKYYGIQGYQDLQTRWTGYAFKESAGGGIAQSGE